ncbi:hypothetical protein SDC9_122626 [bioreactor metagenome]|uniref:Uncharacterized protein n=1 Tax=bioreactor metagenome TaxID=1076179 RepID=A0A645CFJ9_9ZZZZ
MQVHPKNPPARLPATRPRPPAPFAPPFRRAPRQALPHRPARIAVSRSFRTRRFAPIAASASPGKPPLPARLFPHAPQQNLRRRRAQPMPQRIMTTKTTMTTTRMRTITSPQRLPSVPQSSRAVETTTSTNMTRKTKKNTTKNMTTKCRKSVAKVRRSSSGV